MSISNELDFGNDVYKNLRIPDAIKDLPRYEGSRHTLYEFIENVEEILSLCISIDGQPCSKIFLRAIRNKITGEANEVLTMYGTPLEWEAIKENLVTHYANKRNETNLVRDLYNISQGSDSIEKYFSKIIDIQSTIINHIKLNEDNFAVIRAKKDLYQEMCLNTFLAGLKEPLGSMIRAMRPTSLAEAFSSCIKEQNITYLKKPSFNLPLPQRPLQAKPLIPQRNNYHGPPILQTRYTQYPQYPQYSQHPQYNHKPTPQYYNHRPFTNQNPNQNGQPNFNKNRFTSKAPMVPPRRDVPMDTSSNPDKFKQYTYNNKPNFNSNQYQFKPTAPPRFQAQELFNIENPEEETVEYHQEEEPQMYFPDLDEGEIDDENFCPEASPTESDT